MTVHPPTRPGARMGLWTVCAGLALAACAPAVAAESVASGQLTATKVMLPGGGTQAGDLLALHTARDEGLGLPGIQLEGAVIKWTQGDQSGETVRAPNGATVPVGSIPRGLAQTLGVEPAPQQQSESHATFVATSAQSQYIVHIYPTDTTSVSAEVEEAATNAVQDPHFGLDGIRQGTTADGQGQQMSPYDFQQFELSSPVVLTAASGISRVTLEGSFIVEVLGLNGTITGDSGVHEVQSGRWQQPLSPGAPSGTAYNERYIFLRIWVEGGTADLVLTGDALNQWAGSGSSLDSAGPVTLHGVSGYVTTATGQEVAVQTGQYTLDEGRHSMLLRPAAGTLDVAVTGIDAEGNPIWPNGSIARKIPSELLVTVAILLVGLAGVAAGAWAVQRRLRRQPTMADVEALLEGGRYRQAAKDAARILRRKPGMETALISRAIALSKAGRNQAVVQEVEQHLKGSDPSDGVLHYVLGVAYADLGQDHQAEAAFQEALSRTPDLLPEVRTRLPSGSRLPAPSTKSPAETHGYA